MVSEERKPIPFRERRLDQLFVAIFTGFALTSFLFDRLAAVHQDLEAQTGVLARALVHYGRTIDPLVLANPLWLRLMSGFSAFVMGPFYLLLIVALVRGDERIRIPAMIYASIILYSFGVHVGVELLGDLPPKNLPAMLAIYAPYGIFPAVLLGRMKGPHPFTRPH